MNQVTIDATGPEICLLRTLWSMASPAHAMALTDVLPGRAVECRWSELYCAWQEAEPTLSGLQQLRATLDGLSRRQIRVLDAPDDIVADAPINVSILSDDEHAMENTRLLINLSGYTQLILKAHLPR